MVRACAQSEEEIQREKEAAERSVAEDKAVAARQEAKKQRQELEALQANQAAMDAKAEAAAEVERIEQARLAKKAKEERAIAMEPVRFLAKLSTNPRQRSLLLTRVWRGFGRCKSRRSCMRSPGRA